MPDDDGLEVITEAKKRYPTSRIMVMTGGGQVLERGYLVKLAKAMGAHVAILKPFCREEFVQTVSLAVQPLEVHENAPPN